MRWRFWLRWSARDLRQRRVQVIVIALVIALGTGLAAGLASLKSWRIASNDASFELLRFHDLRATLPDGGFAREGALRRAAASVDGVADARERLVVPTQVDASRGERATLVPGRLVGQPVDPEPVVDGLAADRGRILRPADEGRPVAALERNFADARGLPVRGAVQLAGGGELAYVGSAFQPEYFIGGQEGTFGTGHGDFAVVFTSLATAQELTGRRGRVNELVLRTREGAQLDRVEAEVRAAIDRVAGTGVTITRAEDETSYRLLYQDAEGDQQIWRVLSVLILVGAALAAYNLISRTVEAERREIGIGMALGVPPGQLARRPVLMGAQIAVLGALFGAGIGLLISRLFRNLLRSLLPLPVWETPFQLDQFAVGALIGLLLPMLGVLVPVWRAVRMRPVDAIRIGFRAAGGGGLAPLLARVRIPGDSLAQMPLRNVARAPRRTLVTVLGIGVIVAMVVTFTGLIDSFVQPLDRARAEAERTAPDRLRVGLDGFRPVGGTDVRGVLDDPSVGGARPQNVLAVTLEHAGEDLDAALTTFDWRAPGWRPSIRAGSFGADAAGILLARQAADDLGLEVGDELVVRHPVLEGPGRARLVRSTVRVDGLHGGPLRPVAYGAAPAWDRRTGLAGLANEIEAQPAPRVSEDEVIRSLFGRPGVASVQAVTAPLDTFDEELDRFLWIIYVTEAFVLLLALLVAFNSAAISADERRREHATMFAYGVPRRTVLLQSVAESGLVGFLASIIGVAIGALIVGWIVRSIIPETIPEIEVGVVVDAGTLAVAAAIGILACGLAPLFTARRLGRMDVPGTLRVME